MADTKRQKLIAAIVARLEGISTANEYETDFKSVNDWKVNFNEEDLPAISVCDTVADVDFANGQPDAGIQIFTLPVLVRIFLAPNTPGASARKMLGDVVKAIGLDPLWTVDGRPLAIWTKLTKEGLIVPNDSFEIAGAAVELEIAYITQSFNSYE